MGELLGLLRRDTPEKIIPELARDVNVVAVREPSWGSWTQITAGLAYPFLLCGLITELDVGASGTGPLNLVLGRRRRWQVGTGATPDVVALGHASLHGWAYAAGAVYVSALAKNQPYVPFNPILIPSSTAIKVRATDQDLYSTPNSEHSGRTYLVGYEGPTLARSCWLLAHDLYERGVAKCHAETIPATGTTTFTPSSAGGAGSGWSWGSWTELVASLNDNYLITGASVHPDVVTDQYSVQVQLGTGAAGYEIPRAAMALVESVYPGPVTTMIDFPYPFVAFKGDRLAVRGASYYREHDYGIAVQAVRLHKD